MKGTMDLVVGNVFYMIICRWPNGQWHSRGSDDCIFKNSVGAGCQYFDQRFNSRHMGEAGSRADFLHTLDHALAMYGEVNDSVLGHILQGDCGNDMQLRGCQSSHLASMGHDRPIQGLFLVDFTTFTHFNPLTNKRVCIVFVHNLDHQGQGKFYYLVGGGSLAVAELIPCDMIPTERFEFLISHSIPVMAVSGKAGSCSPLVGSLQYRTLANYMYWFPLPFQLPVVI